jgi:hypothetical protein
MNRLNATRTVYVKPVMAIFAFSWKVATICMRHLPGEAGHGPSEGGAVQVE